MNKNKIKESVLQELIDLMESKEVEGLKSKSPKFMKLQVEAVKPEMELDEEMESEDKPMMDEIKDNKMMKPEMKEESNPEDDEDMQRLLEMYRQLK
jgi:hypothetical protein